MTALLTANIDLIATTTDGVQKLRDLILQLAVMGKLVRQDRTDEPAGRLLGRILDEKAKLDGKQDSALKKNSNKFADVAPIFDLPSNWIWTCLDEICFVNPRNSVLDNTLASFIPMTLIGTTFTGNHGQDQRTWKEIKKGFTHFADGDVGIAKITPCFENGKACVFQELFNGVGAGTTELHIVRPIPNTLDPKYVLAYLKSLLFLKVGETKMTGTAGQKRLPKEFVQFNPFPLPPLAEQVRIVAKIYELMNLCDSLEAQQTNAEAAHTLLVKTILDALVKAQDQNDFATTWDLIKQNFDVLFTTEKSIDALKQTLLQLAVMGKLVRQDRKNESASALKIALNQQRNRFSSFKGKTKNNEQVLPLFEVPQGWCWTRLRNIVNRSESGWSPSCDNRPRNGNEWGVLKVSAVSWGKFLPEENKALPANLSPRQECAIKHGDFLISRANTSELVARSVVVDGHPSCLMMSDKIVRLEIADGVNRHYVNMYNASRFARNYYERVAGGTSSSMKNVSREQILDLEVPLPPLVEQDGIVAKFNELIDLCDRLKNEICDVRLQQEKISVAIIESALTKPSGAEMLEGAKAVLVTV